MESIRSRLTVTTAEAAADVAIEGTCILHMQDYGGPVGFRIFTARPDRTSRKFSRSSCRSKSASIDRFTGRTTTPMIRSHPCYPITDDERKGKWQSFPSLP